MPKRYQYFLLVFVSNLGIFSYSAAQNSGTAEALVRSIYDAHRPWDDYKSHEEEKRIDFSNEKQISKYFDAELITLFQRDLACFEKTKMICGINVDPVFFSQDSVTDAGYEIGLRRIKETDFYAEYEVLVQWIGFPKPKSGEIFILNKTNNGWRVSDIQSGDFSLKKSMDESLRELGF